MEPKEKDLAMEIFIDASDLPIDCQERILEQVRAMKFTKK